MSNEVSGIKIAGVTSIQGGQGWFQCSRCNQIHERVPFSGVQFCPTPEADIKLASYLQQENSVLHEKLKKLEAALDGKLVARVLKSDEHGRATIIAVDDKAYIAAWKVNGDISQEIEACAKVAEAYGYHIEKQCFEDGSNAELEAMIDASQRIATLIRGRGET